MHGQQGTLGFDPLHAPTSMHVGVGHTQALAMHGPMPCIILLSMAL